MCQAGFSFYKSRALLSAAYAARPEGVPVLWALLTHLGKFGAWPSCRTIAAVLRRPLDGDRAADGPAYGPRLSIDSVQRALAAYVRAGILERSRRGGCRSWVYQLAEPFRSQLAGEAPIRAPERLPAESLGLKAAPVRPSSRTRAARSIMNRSQEQIPLTPMSQDPRAPTAARRTGTGGGAPPVAPPDSPAIGKRDDAGAQLPAPSPRPPADPPPVPRDSPRPEVAIDLRQLDDLLRWYAATWAARYGRPYLPDRRTDPRRLRTLLGWATADGAIDGAAWVRSYLRAFLALAGYAAENGHSLGDATRPRHFCRPRRAPPAATARAAPRAAAAPGVAVMSAAQLEQLGRLAGKRRAAGGV